MTKPQTNGQVTVAERKPLLDYSESVVDSTWGPLTNFVNPSRAAFFSRPGWCPYCKSVAPTIFDQSQKWEPEDNDDPCLEEYYWAQVWSCQSCGWWDLFQSQNSGHDSIDPVYVSETVRHAVLRSYDITEAEVPISSLRAALRKRGENIRDMHPSALEELVASVLRDHFPNCIARVCGRSHDRGIDMIVVEADRNIAVQVKRRSRSDSVERVMQVREFLGTSLVEGFDHLMYVSTADHFSTGHASAEEFAARAVDRRVVQSFELVDRNQLLGMLNLASRESEQPWREHVPRILLTGKR